MNIKILGCSGGIASGLHTTSFLVNENILIDAGTGLGRLTLPDLLKIRAIFITHAHLDHITSIPFLADSVFDQHTESIQVHALDKTADILMNNIFNNNIWPDFSVIPTPGQPVLKFMSHKKGDVIKAFGLEIELLPAKHGVPATGYLVKEGNSTLIFSGDTTSNDLFWKRLNMLDRIDCLIVEAAFPDRYKDIAEKSFHYCPSILAKNLELLKHDLVSEVHITHMKPGFENEIMEECRRLIKGFNVIALVQGEIICI